MWKLFKQRGNMINLESGPVGENDITTQNFVSDSGEIIFGST